MTEDPEAEPDPEKLRSFKTSINGLDTTAELRPLQEEKNSLRQTISVLSMHKGEYSLRVDPADTSTSREKWQCEE